MSATKFVKSKVSIPAGKNGMRPIHPGEVLREDYLKPLSLSANALALAIRVPANRITAIVNETRGITADTALRLARYFRTTPQIWLNLQLRYDLEAAEERLGARIRRLKVRRPGVNS